MKENKLRKGIMLPAMAALILAGGIAVSSQSHIASAATVATSTTHTHSKTGHKKGSAGSGVRGTVAAINGNSITLTGKKSTTYTVDATNAKVTKFTSTGTTTRPATSIIAVSGIEVGDTLMVRGTVSGTSVTATKIADGTFTSKAHTGTRVMTPHVAGTVTAVNGNSITVSSTRKSVTTVYTVDVTNAKVMQKATTKGVAPVVETASAITVGSNVMVRGTVSGTSVTAKDVITGLTLKK